MGTIDRPALLKRLAAGATAISASRRLARFLKREFDRAQRDRDLRVWPTPDVLPLAAWLQRAYADAAPPEAPLLLSPLQEQALWERAVAESESANALLQTPSTAAVAREAWTLAHAYRVWDALEAQPLNDDARAFLRWAKRYRSLSQDLGAIEAARLPDRVAAWVREGAVTVPPEAVLCGFDETPPQQRELFAALEAAGCATATLSLPRRPAQVRRVELLSAREEIGAAARWARARLEADPDARIGIVVPDLARHRLRAVRAFVRAMRPAAGLPGVPGRSAAVQCLPGRAAGRGAAGGERPGRARSVARRDRRGRAGRVAAFAVSRRRRERGGAPRAAGCGAARPRRAAGGTATPARRGAGRRRRGRSAAPCGARSGAAA